MVETAEAESGGAIVYAIDIPPKFELFADPDHVLRVIENLCRNAAQALRGRGAQDGRPPAIRLAAIRTDDVALIEVSDSGPGFPAEQTQHIFEPFHLSTREGGAGLGLAIAADLVTRNGGSISLAEAKSDDFYCGARFLITLPTPGPAARRSPRRRRPAPPHKPQPRRPFAAAAREFTPARRSFIARDRGEGSGMREHEPIEGKYQAINFVASAALDAEAARQKLVERYGDVPYEQANVIVALGGDGTMLQTLHNTISAPKPVFGINRGSLGFLMNDYSERGLRGRLAAAQPSIIHPLLMRARDVRGEEIDGAGDQRSVAVAPEISGRQDRDRGRRPRAARGIGRRRRAGGDAGGLHRLQSFRQRPDPAVGNAADGADADLRLPAAALARRAAVRPGESRVSNT